MPHRSPAFSDEALRSPLFIGHLDALQQKLDRSSGLLREYWEDFRGRLMADSRTRDEMLFLPALFSDELADEAKQSLQRYCRVLPASDTAGDFQFHTWCRCGSVIRRAAFFDWLHARGAWSSGDIEEAAECFLGFGYKHAFPVLTSRTRASNNQNLSMALYCAVVGFLFGHKLSQHPTGRFLFEYGMSWLPDLIGLFPADGYGGEGSTYTSHVNTPLCYWACSFLNQLTGHQHFDTPFPPNNTTLRRLLEMERKLLSPGGLLAPWDHYGWQKGVNASAFAYLARMEQNPRYLSLIAALGLWPNPGYLAWGADDPMWTLIWWPDEFANADDATLPEELFGWFLPRTGAALDSVALRSRLLQVWDISSDTIAGVGRAQVNPNHVVFEIDGEPVFQDGVQTPGTDPWAYPAEKVLARLSPEARDRFFRYRAGIGGSDADPAAIVAGIAPGLIGGANAIVVDEEPWYWPGEARVGHGTFYASSQGLQVVSADAATFYQPAYDITLARRTSVWTDAGFGVILDTLEADSPHMWRWQVYLRPTVKRQDHAIHIDAGDGHDVLLAWDPGSRVCTEPVEDFPASQEGRSVRLDLVRHGPAARFAVVIAPHATTATVRWSAPCTLDVMIDGKTHRLVVDNVDRQAVPLGDASTTARFAWLAADGRRAEIEQGEVGPVKPDVSELSDIDIEHGAPSPEIGALLPWQADPPGGAGSRLNEIDQCLAQLVVEHPDFEMLSRALEAPGWPLRMAAAEVLGQRGTGAVTAALRRGLEAEHAIPEAELYPPLDAEPSGAAGEDKAKRWRLKAALIVALGRLHDGAAVPLLARILADNRDFYCVYSVAAQALGRIGGREALGALAPALAENEVNTYLRARHAKAAIERKLNPGPPETGAVMAS